MLEFTPQDHEARRYLLEQGEDGNEHLYVYDAETGECLHRGTDGKRWSVRPPVLPPGSGPRLVLHHNHPSLNPPSAADTVMLLSEPGIRAIWVHAKDRSAFRITKSEERPSPDVVRYSEGRARRYFNDAFPNTELFTWAVRHASLLALRHVGLIGYDYTIAESLRISMGGALSRIEADAYMIYSDILTARDGGEM